MAIRSLKPGEKIPDGEPRKYRHSKGYIRLRWFVGPGQHVETYEHRVFDGYVTTAPEVHHRNEDKTDNSPENLEEATRQSHAAHHRLIDDEQVAEMYLGGMSIPAISRALGWNTGALSRSLKRSGTPTRI